MENNRTQFLNSTATAANGERSRLQTDYEFLKKLPSGFQFRPTDQELIASYLMKKVNNQKLPPNLFNDVNVYKFHPQTLSESYKLEGENDMYFFSPREKKYKNGKRPNRMAQGGFWKASGTGKSIKLKNGREIGCKSKLVFYQGCHKRNQKTPWIMHEFTVSNLVPRQPTHEGDMTLDDWVLCKIFYDERKPPSKKRNRQATEEMCDQETRDNTNEVLDTAQEKPPMAEPKSCSNNMGGNAAGTSRVKNSSPIATVAPGSSGVKRLPEWIGENHGEVTQILAPGGQFEVNNNGNPMMCTNSVPSFEVPTRRREEEKRKVDSSGSLGSIVEESHFGYNKRSRPSGK